MPVEPHRWSATELSELTAAATNDFRTRRRDEPRTVYSEFFQSFVPVFRSLIDQSLPALAETLQEANRKLIAGLVADKNTRMAFRYLAGPPISEDDLKTLAQSRLSAAALRTDQEQAERVREVVLSAIDPHRFPWVEAGRPATEREREIAVISSAALLASQRVGTRRRSNAKKQQEDDVRRLLNLLEFNEVAPRVIRLLEDAPTPG